MNVTVVGITNERLVPYLREALNRKRTDGPPDAFWNSLRVVFLGEQLLEAINDEREEFHDPREALRQRRLEATWARRSIGVFLKRTNPSRWTLYNWQYLPVLTGTLFEFEDHRKLVHLLVRPPRRPSFDGLYVDIEDNVDEFSAVFEDIVHHSTTDSMIVPVGAPTSEGFKSNEVRLQARVLKDGSGASGWLPMVIVITWRYRNNRAEPILQLRTIENSAREENRISHLGGHILQQDLARPEGRTRPEAQGAVDSMHESLLSAAKRIVRDATGSDPGDGLQSMATGSYLYPDMEHLYFFVFALELTEATHFPRRAEMHSFRLAELVAIRANQVLTAAAQLCRAADVTARAFAAATEVVALNLVLHDYAELAAAVRGLPSKTGYERASVAAVISELIVDRTAPSWMPGSREVLLEGLAGWHYREFFSVLLPLYAKVGIDQAAELQAAIEADDAKRGARDRLAEIYRDEDLMAVMPLEL
jgi:ADP-ribose pyrophosphatase YjhB (NUDIX family)